MVFITSKFGETMADCAMLWDCDELNFLVERFDHVCDKFVAPPHKSAALHLRAPSNEPSLTIIKKHFGVVIEGRSHLKQLKRSIKTTN